MIKDEEEEDVKLYEMACGFNFDLDLILLYTLGDDAILRVCSLIPPRVY